MIFNMTGGGAGLNFTVTGGEQQPQNPQENTIWITTGAEITGWVMSMSQPAAPVEGLVWIELGISPEVELNALKKNAIQLYLLSAVQYVNGKWAEKDTSIYQNGEWVDVLGNIYLFRNGSQYSEITGGWDGTATVDSDGLMYFAPADGSNGLCTVNKVSKRNATKLCVNLTSFSSSAGSDDFGVVLSREFGSAHSYDVIASIDVDRTGTHTLDLAEVTEDFYVYAYIWQTASAKVDAIWLE